MKLSESPDGYSGKALVVKLGIKKGFTIFVINPPINYFKALGGLPTEVIIKTKLTGIIDFVHYFTDNKKKFYLSYRS